MAFEGVMNVNEPTNSKIVILTRELFEDVSNFIADKKIDSAKIKKYEKVLEILEARKKHWAFNRELSPIDSIKVYGAYSTVYGTLYGAAKALDLGIKRLENPKAAKEVYSLLNNAANLIPKLEKVHIEQNKSQISPQLIAEIFDDSRALRRQAISKQIIWIGEIPNRQKLITELQNEVETQLG